MAETIDIAPALAALKGKKRLFVLAYVAHNFNGTQAAIEAGYSVRAARRISAENLTKADITAAIDALVAEKIKPLEIRAEQVVREIANIGFANLKDYADLVFTGDVTELTDDQAAALESIQVDHYVEGAGDEAKLVKRVRIKFHPKLAALTLIAKHLNIAGFRADTAGPPKDQEHPVGLLASNDPLREDTLQALDRVIKDKKLLPARGKAA